MTGNRPDKRTANSQKLQCQLTRVGVALTIFLVARGQNRVFDTKIFNPNIANWHAFPLRRQIRIIVFPVDTDLVKRTCVRYAMIVMTLSWASDSATTRIKRPVLDVLLSGSELPLSTRSRHT